MRRVITGLMIIAGIAMMVFGYFMAAPWGAESVVNSNPRLEFAPAIFVFGVVFLFSSALVYELIPNRHD